MRLAIFSPECFRMLESETLGLRHSTVRFSIWRNWPRREDSERAERARGPFFDVHAAGRPAWANGLPGR
jgi:hypothetical protein